jgi:very-short-patch-repair endonuclease
VAPQCGAGVVDLFFSFTFISLENKSLFNRKGLKSYRSSLRNRSTPEEALFWDTIKSKNPDGDPHGEYHKIQEDETRDKYIESLGFNVLRFENRFVFQEPEYLKNEIRKVINKKEETI